jgi:septation ring formation regulator EzrA
MINEKNLPIVNNAEEQCWLLLSQIESRISQLDVDFAQIRDDQTKIRDDQTKIRDDQTKIRDDQTKIRDDIHLELKYVISDLDFYQSYLCKN